MTRRVQHTQPQRIGTFIENGVRYATGPELIRLVDRVARQDKGLLARLAED